LFKFNLKVDSLRIVSDGVRKSLDSVIRNNDLLGEIGQFSVERIKYQARIGKPLNEDGDFRPLKQSTVKHRRYLEKHNPVHDTYKAQRSNLTLTGKLLDSLRYEVKRPGVLSLYFSGQHPGYKTGAGSTNRESNSQIIKWLFKKGFVVFDKSLNTNNKFKSRIKTMVLRHLRRAIATRRRL